MNAMSEIEIRDSCSNNSTTSLFSGSKSLTVSSADINFSYLQDLPLKWPNFEHLFHQHNQQQQQQQFVFDHYVVAGAELAAAAGVEDHAFFPCSDDQDSAFDDEDVNLVAVNRSSVYCNVNPSGSCSLLFSSSSINSGTAAIASEGNTNPVSMSDIETPNWLRDEPIWLRDEPANENCNCNSSDDIIGSVDDRRGFPSISYIDFPGHQDLIVAGDAECSTEKSVVLQGIMPLCEDGVTDLKIAEGAAAMVESKDDEKIPVAKYGSNSVDCVVDNRFRGEDNLSNAVVVSNWCKSSNTMVATASCSDAMNGSSPQSSLTDTGTQAAESMNPETVAGDSGGGKIAVAVEEEERRSLDNMMAATDHDTFKDCLAHELQDLTSFETGLNHVGLSDGVSSMGSTSTDRSIAADSTVAILGGGGNGNGGGATSPGVFSNSAILATPSISSSFATLITSASASDLYSNNYSSNYSNAAVLSHTKSLPPRFLHCAALHEDRGGGGGSATVPLFCNQPAAMGSVQELMNRSNSNIASFASSPTALFRSQDRLLRSTLGAVVQPNKNVIEGAEIGAISSNHGEEGGAIVHDLSSLHWKSPAAKTRAARKRRMAKSRLPTAAIQPAAAAAAKGWLNTAPPLQGAAKASGTKKMLQSRDRGGGGTDRNSSDSGGACLVATTPAAPRPPLDLPQGKRLGPGNVNSQLRFLLQKELKPSDVGTLGRIVLPKRDAEAHLPDLTAREGINLVMEDLVNSKVWNLRFRFWPNNKSRMYLLENTRDFVKTHNLQEGDFLMIYKDDHSGKYLIRAKKVARLDHASNNASSGRKIQRSSSQSVNLGNNCHAMSNNVNESAMSRKGSNVDASFQDSLIMQDLVVPKSDHDTLACLDNDTKIELNDMHIEEMFEL